MTFPEDDDGKWRDSAPSVALRVSTGRPIRGAAPFVLKEDVMATRRMLARTGVCAATIVLVGAPTVASAATNHFSGSTTCTNWGCTGKDPQLSGCGWDARSIRSTPIVSNGKTVGWVDLRWSPTCGNNWARVRSAIGVQQLTATATRADGAKQRASATGTATWTPMVFGRDQCVSATGRIGWASATTPCA
jgi:hypothetical protein